MQTPNTTGPVPTATPGDAAGLPLLILLGGWGFGAKALLPLKTELAWPSAVALAPGDVWQASPPPVPGVVPAAASGYAAGLAGRLAAARGRALVVGWSLGGMIALETALAYPGRIGGLVLVSATARFRAGPGDPPGVEAAVLRAMALGLRRAPQAVLQAFTAQVYAPAPVPAAARLMHALDTALLDADDLRRGLGFLRERDLRAGLDRLETPTLVMHGQEDRIVPWRAGRWLSRRIPGCRWSAIEGEGHGLPLRQPAALAAEIRAFARAQWRCP